MKTKLLLIMLLVISCNSRIYEIGQENSSNDAKDTVETSTPITPTSDDMIVFATSSTYGNPVGAFRNSADVDDADDACEAVKSDSRTYKAVLTTGTGNGDLISGLRLARLTGRVLTLVNDEYQVVADSYLALFQTTTTPLKIAIAYDADGNLISTGGGVWTGTLEDGSEGLIANDNSDIYFEGTVTLGRLGDTGPTFLNNETALDVESVNAHYYCISQ